jgi:hypothetical protein
MLPMSGSGLGGIPALVSSRPTADRRSGTPAPVEPTRIGAITLAQPDAIPPLPPGLRAQFGATRDAAIRLAMAHVELAKAEAAAIGGQIARFAGLLAAALAFVFLIGMLVFIGTALFTGEWLLGSMGWGILHGALAFGAVAMTCVLAAIGVSGRRLGGAFLVGLLSGIVLSLIFAFAVPNAIYTAIGDAIDPAIEPGIRPLVVGVVIWAIIGLVAAVALTRQAGGAGGSLVAAVLGGLVLGGLVGAFTAITFEPQVGVGIGTALGYVAWIAAMGIDIARTGVDTEALKARFTPTRTIETSKETLEWLQSKMPPGTGS